MRLFSTAKLSLTIFVLLLQMTTASHQEHLFRRKHRHLAHQVVPRTPETIEQDGPPTVTSKRQVDAPWVPMYRRKAESAHQDGTTCHHFDAFSPPSYASKIACAVERDVAPSSPPNDKAFEPTNLNAVLHTRWEFDQSEDEDDDKANERRTNGYKLIKSYAGSKFFDEMSFFTGHDPSGGMIQYVDQDEAKKLSLIGVRNNHAFMQYGKHTTATGAVHQAVRVSTKDTFTTGIFVLDAYHMPTGCGVWPSFWTNPTHPEGGWPNGGEIDIIEGVNFFSRNMQSIHAPSPCRMPNVVNMLGKLAMPDEKLQRNCDPRVTDDQGCGVQSQAEGTYGSAYNDNGGGVHAMVWDDEKGIQVFFFPRHNIPSDIRNNDPNPSAWGKPQGSWPADECNPAQYFKHHVAVFTNTVCGTWAGAGDVWSNKGPGQDFTCAEKTHAASCADYMRSNPDLSQAYWEIESLKIYQLTRKT